MWGCFTTAQLDCTQKPRAPALSHTPTAGNRLGVHYGHRAQVLLPRTRHDDEHPPPPFLSLPQHNRSAHDGVTLTGRSCYHSRWGVGPAVAGLGRFFGAVTRCGTWFPRSPLRAPPLQSKGPFSCRSPRSGRCGAKPQWGIWGSVSTKCDPRRLPSSQSRVGCAGAGGGA